MDETDDCLTVLVAGIGGGPIDVRVDPIVDVRGFVATDETREFDGVPVRDVLALDVAVPSCFVGDLVGD